MSVDAPATATPGPWKVDGHNLSCVIRCIRERGHPDAQHTCGDYEFIARCEGPNWRSNARLIAASSVMADALEAVLLFHGGGPWDGEKLKRWVALTNASTATTKGLCDTIRTALALAHGAGTDGEAGR